jgi:hypothetical protein
LGNAQAKKANEAEREIERALRALRNMDESIEELGTKNMTPERVRMRAKTLRVLKLELENALLRAQVALKDMKRITD